MASAAILRSAARSLGRLRQPLEQQRGLLARRPLSSSVPTERCTNTPSGLSNSMEKTRLLNEMVDINQRILRKVDMLSDCIDEQGRLIKQLEAKMKQSKRYPWVVSVPVSFLLFALYNHIQG